MDIGCGNWQPLGEWKCVCKSHFDKRGRRLSWLITTPPLSVSFFFPVQNRVFVPSNSCPAFAPFDAVKFINIHQGWRERERLIFSRGSWVPPCQHQHWQQVPDPLPFGISHRPTAGNLPCHRSGAGWGGLPRTAGVQARCPR